MKTLEMVKTSIKTILIVDDEVTVSEIVKFCLSDLGGWDASVVNCPLEGLQKAESDCPDAIVLDISMPKMDGIEFLERLRNNPKTQAIPVVLLSGHARWLDPQILRKYQVAGAIAKPFDASKLSIQIAKILNWDSTFSTD